MTADILRAAADMLDGHMRVILVDRHREIQGPSGRKVREALAAMLREDAEEWVPDPHGEAETCCCCSHQRASLAVARALSPP